MCIRLTVIGKIELPHVYLYKKTLVLSLPYIGDVSLQTRTKLRKSFKGILNCCKLQIVFKSQRKLANVFQFKDCLPFNLVSGVVYKYTCERCNSSHYGETDRHLKVRSGEYIGISPLTFRKVKPSKENAIHAHLLNCNNIPSFDEFTIFTKYQRKLAYYGYSYPSSDTFWNRSKKFDFYCKAIPSTRQGINLASQLKLAECFPKWVFPKFVNPIKLKNKYYWFFVHTRRYKLQFDYNHLLITILH